jgi:uncharacterized damage-inducible protein DinB
MMNLTELFLAELDREAARSRRALEQVPEGKHDWKPHEKSMVFSYLAELVATMPRWIALGINQDELDINPPGGSQVKRTPMHTCADYLAGHEKAVGDARTALQGTTEEHLLQPWRLLAGGRVVWETTRHEMICDTFNHLAHHRGQMTVYLRLLGAKVPAIYGPSADDRSFA